MCVELRTELSVLKAQPSGVVDAHRLLDWNRSQPEPRPIVVGREYQVAEACARLNQPASAGGWRVDVACCAVCGSDRSALSANHGEQVRIPEGWQLVPVEPTKAMLFACEDAGSIHNQKRGKRIYQAMLAAAPSAGSQEQE